MHQAFAVLGWLVVVFACAVVSVGWCINAFDGLGRYNIGGVPNSGFRKLRIGLAALFVLVAWCVVVAIAPFHLTFTL